MSVRVPPTNFIHGTGDKISSSIYRGYVNIDPDICFDLFFHGEIEARSFYHFYPSTKLTIPENQPAIRLTESMLMVSDWDFRAFTEIYEVPIAQNKKSIGRPDKVNLYIMEYWRRVKSGAANQEIAKESRELERWGHQNFPASDVPCANAIRNALTKDRKRQSVA